MPLRRRALGRPLAAFALSFLALLPMAAVGTLAHEVGHFAAAELLGYEAQFHYGSVSWEGAEPARPWHRSAIGVAGPAVNMLIGSIGLVWLLRRRTGAASLSAGTAIASLLALFWSRQAFVAGRELIEYGSTGAWGPSDEVRLAIRWGLPAWSLLALTATIALGVCTTVVSSLPRRRRGAIAAGALVGAVSGFYSWHGVLGPVLLP